MATRKHLTLEERIIIEDMLNAHKKFSEIARRLEIAPSTISREIRSRSIYKQTGSMGANYNACVFRYGCTRSRICSPCNAGRRGGLCRTCKMCNTFCSDFRKEECSLLLKPPYVCNGCARRTKCTLEKYYYNGRTADAMYRELLSESRTGISLSEEEVRCLDDIVSPLVLKNQSPHVICSTNKDSIMVSQSSIYRYIESGILSAKNIDLQRKVRYSARKKTVHVKVDKKCRIGRTYEDFLAFMDKHPDTPVVELDSVEGKKGGKVLLTIHFKKAEMMLSFIRKYNDSKSVIDIFNMLYKKLGPDIFRKLFKVCLADNGSEFSNPLALEFDSEGNRRTFVFYCKTGAPYQKGSAEKNHEFIRLFIPKGKDMEPYSQKDISFMMDNINSYSRESLGDKTPHDTFSFLYGPDVLKLLGCNRIMPGEVTLNSSVFRRERNNDI